MLLFVFIYHVYLPFVPKVKLSNVKKNNENTMKKNILRHVDYSDIDIMMGSFH